MNKQRKRRWTKKNRNILQLQALCISIRSAIQTLQSIPLHRRSNKKKCVAATVASCKNIHATTASAQRIQFIRNMCMCVSKYRYGFMIYINPHVCIFFPMYKQIRIIDEVRLLRASMLVLRRCKKKSNEQIAKNKQKNRNVETKNEKKNIAMKPKILFRKCNDLKMFCHKNWQHSDGDAVAV